ncbi:MAG TPA: MarR family transcriptional regulator [Acidimicrobiales bacterium]|jgi:DNA-binding MarR family transcriptional regulator|nr:MarR family transcriptional regulator [Acidimicrobiales bacterium]
MTKRSALGLTDALVQMSFAVMTVLNRVAADHDLSTTQLRVLGILVDRQPKMTELAEHLGLDKSSISGLIDRAQARGLVERIASPDDGRSVHVSLTREGHTLARIGGQAIRQSVATLVGQLDVAERDQLRELLARLTA